MRVGCFYVRITSYNVCYTKLLRESIYAEIDKMEKSRIEVTEYTKRKEEFLWFAVFAGLFLLMEVYLRNTIFRNLP